MKTNKCANCGKELTLPENAYLFPGEWEIWFNDTGILTSKFVHDLNAFTNDRLFCSKICADTAFRTRRNS